MRLVAIALAVLILLTALPAHAGGVSVSTSKVLDRWTLDIGGYLTGLSTDVRLDNPIDESQGTEINLEDDLGFSSSQTVPRFRLAFIMGKRHQISAGYYKTERDSTTTISQEIEWGEETFPINVDLGAFLDTEFADVAYTFWFYTSENTSLGVTGGLVLATISSGAGVRLVGQDFDLRQDINTDVPVPQLGFSVNHYLGSRFVLAGGLGYIAFNLDDWEGAVASANVAVEHRTWKNLGFGLGYGYTDYDIDAKSQDFLGKFNYNVSGFQVFARAAW